MIFRNVVFGLSNPYSMNRYPNRRWIRLAKPLATTLCTISLSVYMESGSTTRTTTPSTQKDTSFKNDQSIFTRNLLRSLFLVAQLNRGFQKLDHASDRTDQETDEPKGWRCSIPCVKPPANEEEHHDCCGQLNTEGHIW